MKQSSKAKKIKVACENTASTAISGLYEGQAFDVMLHAQIGKLTGWLSPASMSLAIYDWSSHLAISPAKQLNLVQKAWEDLTQTNLQMMRSRIDEIESQHDVRFKNEAWNEFPYYGYAQTFLMVQKWWNEATFGVRGVSQHHQEVVNFVTRQMLDMMSPSNFLLTNPELISATLQRGGGNLLHGVNNFIEDYAQYNNEQSHLGADEFPVGEKVAITPGKVIYRNQLIELIQYTPTTKRVYAEPILIVPAWIMKYYILDLSPHNSLVKYLVHKGHTVFMISWKNPTSDDRDLGLADYINLGIMHALSEINQIVPHTKVHAAGYCLGGTLLSMAAAAMALIGDERLKTVTLFAAQVDFKDAGELSLFIDQSQLIYLEDIMWEKGYLDGKQMSWAFSMLRSNDLIWSRMIHDYLLGERRPMTDLMAWDHDLTRLPFRMHSEYLHDLFLNNDLVQGHYTVDNKKIALSDITVPIFAIGTLKDHVSPWRSVYKIQLFTNTDVTFVLTSGGHNAGIVSEPGHKHRQYQMSLLKKDDKYLSPEVWLEQAPHYEGSWWPAWQHWLEMASSGKRLVPPMGDPKKNHVAWCDAPGTYVLQK
jgi:polyhydroxyalkanoate synthase